MPRLVQDQSQYFLRAETDVPGDSVRIDVIDADGGWIQNLIAIFPHTIFIKKWESSEAAARAGMRSVPSIWYDGRELIIPEPVAVDCIEIKEAA